MPEWWEGLRFDDLEDELDLVRMTREEVLRRYGVLAMHYRAKLIRERVLTPEVLKDMIAWLLATPDGVRGGRLVWDKLVALVPFEGHGFDRFDVQNTALENMRDEAWRYEFVSSAWWWRLRCVHGIEDPTAWIAAQKARGERGWGRRVQTMAFGRTDLPLVNAYRPAAKCERALQARERQKLGRNHDTELTEE